MPTTATAESFAVGDSDLEFSSLVSIGYERTDRIGSGVYGLVAMPLRRSPFPL